MLRQPEHLTLSLTKNKTNQYLNFNANILSMMSLSDKRTSKVFFVVLSDN